MTVHPEVQSCIVLAKEPLARAFGYFPSVEVRGVSDPESGDEEAIAIISWKGDLKAAKKSFDEFKEDWWYDHMDDAGFLLTFMMAPTNV